MTFFAFIRADRDGGRMAGLAASMAALVFMIAPLASALPV
jgi:hypothetical protein